MPARYFEQANTQYNEFGGTVSADEPHEVSVREALQLPENYMVLGISLFGGWGSYFNATAYVVDDRIFAGGKTLDDIVRENDGDVPVIEIEEIPVTILDLLELLKQFSIHLVDRHVLDAGQRLRIDSSMDFADLPRE